VQEFLSKEQIEQLKAQGISVSESELRRLQKEVEQEKGGLSSTPDLQESSGNFEDHLFGSKPNNNKKS